VTLKLFPPDPDTDDADPTVAAFVRLLDREHSLA